MAGEISTQILESGNTVAVVRQQDAAPFLEYAKEADAGTPDMRHAARIPAVVVEAYCNTNGITFQEFVGNPDHAKAMLNDPALKHFRIWQGRV